MMPDTVEIEDIATTKTAGTIDPDGDYLVGQSAAGNTFRALVEDVVRGVLAGILSQLEIGDDVSIEGGITIDSSTSVVPLQINIDGVRRLGFFQSETSADYNASIVFVAPSSDYGASAGPRIQIGRNNNAATPAAGHFLIRNLNNSAYRIWPDGSGNLRIATTDPSYANDTAGTVVGAQTSMAAAKEIGSELSALEDVAERIRAGAEAVRSWRYRSGAFGGQQFEGVVTDLAPEYGMDRDAAHPAGKSLNEAVILGDLLRMMTDVLERLGRLEDGNG